MITYKISPKHFDRRFPDARIFDFIEMGCSGFDQPVSGSIVRVYINHVKQKIEITEEDLNKICKLWKYN